VLSGPAGCYADRDPTLWAGIRLAAAGGLTSTEIATALRVPAGTVRYRLAMARRALATVLDNYDSPPAVTGEQ
jgi:DNA-directed RNA polymerase specialized sigma24 family protein